MNDDIKRYKDILKDLNTEEERLMKIFFANMENLGINSKGILGIILVLTIFAIVTYLMVAGLFWLVCWCFSLSFWSWKAALGMWLLCIMFGGISVAVN